MSNEKYSAARACGPFDDPALERLRRMGLLTAEGKPDRDALAVVSRLYAGLFYDELCDFYSELHSVNNVCRSLIERGNADDIRLPFLSICWAYDAMYCALPDPVWWIAGNLELAVHFAQGFIRRLSEFTEEAG